MSSEINNRLIAKNTILLYFRMMLTMCIGLYTSRVVLNTLGIVDYGIFNIVGGIVAMFGFINGSMSSSTMRFITFALGKGSTDEVIKTFSMGLLVHFATAAIVLILAETIGLWYFFEKMVIPVERISAAFWAYQCSIMSTLIVIVSAPYNSLIISKEKMGAFAYISILEVSLKLLIVYLLLISDFDKLVFYSILFVVVQLIIRVCYGQYCRIKFPEYHFKIVKDKVLLKKMTMFSMWNMNGFLALLLSTQGVNLVLNLFWGPAVNAAYGIATQVQTKVAEFCANFQTAVNPQITKSYANGNYTNLHHLVITSSKYSYYLMLLISVPILLNIDLILNLWLGIVPNFTSEFVIVMLFYTLVRSMAFAMIASVHATGNLRRFQLCEGTVLLLVVPIAYFMQQYYNVGPVIVVSVYLLVEIVAQIVRIIIVLPMIKMKYKDYFLSVILPISTVSLVVFMLMLLYTIYTTSLDDRGIVQCIISVGFSILVILLCVYVLGCNKSERWIAKNYFYKLFNKRF